MGTAQYLSPEQARGAPVTASSDLYSVGIVLYEMLTGKVPFTGDSAIEIAMKHLNELPKPPSKIRPEIPEELDQVVLRALAKAPEDRYQTAEEFAEDLHRVEAGLPLAPATSDAVTALLAAPGATIGGTTQVLPSDATQVAPPRREEARRPPTYPPGYGYEEPPPKRRRWAPWLLVLLLLAAAGFAGWYVFTKIQDQLNANATVPVPNVVGIEKDLAVAKIEGAGLRPKVERSASKEVKQGFVISQNPDPGVRIQKDDQVTIVVSTGVPKTTVPDVVGMDYADAVDALNQAHLNARKPEVFSKKPVGQVVAQNPKAQDVVPEDSTVVLKVSKGQEMATVPNVVGQTARCGLPGAVDLVSFGLSSGRCRLRPEPRPGNRHDERIDRHHHGVQRAVFGHRSERRRRAAGSSAERSGERRLQSQGRKGKRERSDAGQRRPGSGPDGRKLSA
jgi:serine/threonine-protein kinase